jgi:heme/copper-type cytochrome/quinol oxidase subunit 1
MAAWLGWAFSVPAVAVYSLPAIGVAAELFPVAFKTRQPVRGVMFAAISLVGVAAFAAATQQFVHDVTFDTDGESFVRGALPWLVFSGLPLLGVVVALLLMLLTAKQGVAGSRPSIRAPFVFALFGFLMIAAGIAANFVLGIGDLELIAPNGSAATSFEEGATLYLVYGTTLGVLGGLLFWAPKLWGRVVGDKQAIPLALLGLAGTVLASLPLIIGGFFDLGGGVPASDADVASLLALDGVDGASLWLTLSLVGHGLVALTVVATVGLMFSTFLGNGEPADDNPYGGHTVEWGTSSPAPADNFEHVVTVASAEPQFDLTHEGSTS